MKTLKQVLETIKKDTVVEIRVNGNVVATGYRNHIANDITLQHFLEKLFKVSVLNGKVVLDLIDYDKLTEDRTNILKENFKGAVVTRVDYKTLEMNYKGQLARFDLHTSKHHFMNQVRNIKLVVE